MQGLSAQLAACAPFVLPSPDFPQKAWLALLSQSIGRPVGFDTSLPAAPPGFLLYLLLNCRLVSHRPCFAITTVSSTIPPGFLFYLLLSGGLESLVADPGKVRSRHRVSLADSEPALLVTSSQENEMGLGGEAGPHSTKGPRPPHLPTLVLLRSLATLQLAACCASSMLTLLAPCPAPPRQPAQLRRGVEFATACGAFTCTKPGAIDAQPTAADAEALLADKGRVGQ